MYCNEQKESDVPMVTAWSFEMAYQHWQVAESNDDLASG
jgi:hypothetical protein